MFRNMKTDLVINFSFSDCTARINIENPSSFKNASSAGGKSLVKPVRNKLKLSGNKKWDVVTVC